MATDPATGLPTAPTRVENPVHDDVSICKEFWDREFLQEDVNLFRDLSRATIPAAPLRGSTRDRPARSIRYREFLRPFGWDDELRAVLRIAGSSWGYVNIWRSEGRPPFDAAEVELVASLSKPLAQAIRTHAQAPAVPALGVGQEPGLMLFTADGELISLNDAARGWLDELRAKAAASAPGLAPVGELGFSKEFDVHLPPVVIGTLTHARAIAQEREHGVARARLRSEATGQWLVCHASSLRDADGKPGDITLVIEPVKAAEIAPSSSRPTSCAFVSSRSPSSLPRAPLQPRSPAGSACPRTPSATTSRPSSKRSVSPAAANWWPNCSPTTTPRPTSTPPTPTDGRRSHETTKYLADVSRTDQRGRPSVFRVPAAGRTFGKGGGD